MLKGMLLSFLGLAFLAVTAALMVTVPKDDRPAVLLLIVVDTILVINATAIALQATGVL